MTRPACFMLLLVCLSATFAFAKAGTDNDDPHTQLANNDPAELRIKLKIEGVQSVTLAPTDDGGYRYAVTWIDGTHALLSPDEFTHQLYRDSRSRHWLFRLFNITSPIGIAWVTIGLLGQVLFTGRMLVQWLVSEKHKRPMIPVHFWWMSIIGATMLIIYFIWRADIVGILGQATGWAIYLRNLVLIYRHREPPPAPATAATPEVA